MKLQACPKCDAQFDVSTFDVGQQFSCGSCGEVMTAHAAATAAAGRKPGSARKPGAGRKPGAERTSAGGRAPASGRAGGGTAAAGKGSRKASSSSRAGSGARSGARSSARAGGRRPSAAKGASSAASKGAASGSPASRKPAAGGARKGPVTRTGEAVEVGQAKAGGRQYVPVDRDGKAKSARGGSRRSARAGAPEGASRPSRPRAGGGDRRGEARGGPSPAVIGGLLGVAALGVLALVMFGGGKDPEPTQGDGNGGVTANVNGGGGSVSGGGSAAVPDVPTETALDVLGDYEKNPPKTNKAWKGYIRRFKLLGDAPGAPTFLRSVYGDYVETSDGYGNAEARRFLGHNEFSLTPDEETNFEAIVARDIEYVQGVEAALKKRWFATDEAEEWGIATAAKAQALAHIEREINDHEFRAGLTIRTSIRNKAEFKDYNFAAVWASPYLIIYSSGERITDYELLLIKDKKQRAARRAQLKRRQAQYTDLVEEKGKILQQLYAEFQRRFGEILDLKPLMDVYGGRPDYPPSTRSFRDGAPMVVWIFDTKTSFDKHHEDDEGVRTLPHFVAGYFTPVDGWVMLFDEGEENRSRVFEIGKTVHEGVHQLEWWFHRQRINWAKPPNSQDFLSEGLAEYLGAVKMDKNRKLEFVGVNVTRCSEAQSFARRLKKQKREYMIFPLEALTSFTNYGMARSYAVQTWQVDSDFGMSLLYQQSWAFVYFLNEFEGGKYRERFNVFLDLMMRRNRETGNAVQPAFAEAFEIAGGEDWEDLDDEFQEFMRETVLDLDLGPYEYNPPPRIKAADMGGDDEAPAEEPAEEPAEDASDEDASDEDAEEGTGGEG